jgi:uncharacterized SAM-binding protein YcdF (DUF218 family)
MEYEKEKQMIWNYMLMHHELQTADAIVVLGSFDTNVAYYAAELFKRKLAPVLVCAGSGSVNHDNAAYKHFVGSTEAEVFANIAISEGVPQDKILIEKRSQNTGENYDFTKKLLEERGITNIKRVIAVQKQFMERRTYATGKVNLFFPIFSSLSSTPLNFYF